MLCADDDRPNWRDVLSRGAACAVIARGEISVATFAAALDKATQRLAIAAQDACRSPALQTPLALDCGCPPPSSRLRCRRGLVDEPRAHDGTDSGRATAATAPR